MIFLLLSLACIDSDPIPLPPSAVEEVSARGRMVRAGSVQGYLARPTKITPASEAILLLVVAQDEATRQAASARAETGTIVLAIDPSVQPQAATAYLLDLPGTKHVRTACLRPSCP